MDRGRAHEASVWPTSRAAKVYADKYLPIYRVALAGRQGKGMEGNLCPKQKDFVTALLALTFWFCLGSLRVLDLRKSLSDQCHERNHCIRVVLPSRDLRIKDCHTVLR
jgi:hypothetical protein